MDFNSISEIVRFELGRTKATFQCEGKGSIIDFRTNNTPITKSELTIKVKIIIWVLIKFKLNLYKCHKHNPI